MWSGAHTAGDYLFRLHTALGTCSCHVLAQELCSDPRFPFHTSDKEGLEQQQHSSQVYRGYGFGFWCQQHVFVHLFSPHLLTTSDVQGPGTPVDLLSPILWAHKSALLPV